MKHGNQHSVDELFWQLYELVVAERDMLEKLVRQLSVGGNDAKSSRDKRSYPDVAPKYRNPKNHVETWCGRGMQPRWLTAELQTGKKLSDFLIGLTPGDSNSESITSPSR
jgi:DNA-binding protein H-NS